MAGSRSGDLLTKLAESMLQGKPDSRDLARSCLEHGETVEEILVGGVIRAWQDFAAWYERDPDGALKGWMEAYNATNRVLKELESAIPIQQTPPFSVAVITVRGEGHVLMRDVLALLLKSKGVGVYTSKRGVTPEDLEGPLSDPSLKWLAISCTESALNGKVTELIRWAKARRPDIRVVAGGSQAGLVGADLALGGPMDLLGMLGL
ncbi:MAG: hypothetical protein QFX35_04300 [Candidatus Verstraetearchaeota archaeon]|nr:hypothetical protein [Candidatus Verstraetearchaeota archaeon]